MNEALASPAFGEATLSNCERELIHLAGSIQPHGVLLVVDEATQRIVQATVNAAEFIGLAAGDLLGQPLSRLGGDLPRRLDSMRVSDSLDEPTPLRCTVDDGIRGTSLEGTLHRRQGCLIVELERRDGDTVVGGRRYESTRPIGHADVAAAVKKFSSALNLPSLSNAIVSCVREMTGYDRVMVYQFDPDGHGEIIAEAREPRLESLLGHHYPATDIPQRARELYIRNRVRVLVDVHYEPVPLLPRTLPSGAELDMSLCHLRSMSPLHLQYLKNMGVTGTLVVSLVREGRLWGLIACHHYSPRYVPYAARAVLELLAEVISTRIAAIENYVQSQVEVLVKRLELRLIEATSTDGDWRQALFRNPRTLLTPIDATGAALFHDGEIMTAGDVPSTPDLRALMQWVGSQTFDTVFTCSSVVRKNPAFAAMAPTASGVMAVTLSPSRPDYLMWFRPEQPCEYTWAGDPAKPLINDDPMTLSPRRSFAAWSEIVRGTAAPWTRAETVLARAIGHSLSDIILQIQAVRLLIAQHQLDLVRSQVGNSKDPVVIADPAGRILFSNETFQRLPGSPAAQLQTLDDLAGLFVEPEEVRAMLWRLQRERLGWRGEVSLVTAGIEALPLAARADVVAGQGSSILGFILILTDLTARKRVESARRHFESAILQTERSESLQSQGGSPLREPDEVMAAILANANVAAMEIADAASESGVAPLLEELEVSAQRAAALYRQLRSYVRGD